MPTHTKPRTPVTMWSLWSRSRRDHLRTSSRSPPAFCRYIFHLHSEVVSSLRPLQKPQWESQGAWKSEQAATRTCQSSLLTAPCLLAPSSGKTREINGHQKKKKKRRIFFQANTIFPSTEPMLVIQMNYAHAPFAKSLNRDAAVSLVVLKWGSWDIPSTTTTQTAPWGGTGCPACSSQRSTVSPLQWNAQSWHCGQTLQGWGNKMYT